MRVRGTFSVYAPRGDLQIQATELAGEEGEGLWRLAFERLRARLEAEGWTDPSRKRPLPPFPSAIGVVTSLDGAALRDMLHAVRRRAPWVRVVVRGTRVQGEGAALEIAEAIRTLGLSGRVDLVIAGRGGGSIEDLWAFNEEPVARAISGCPVPVISAVGHETDVTISDLVADLRAPTPTAAAELAVPDAEAVRVRARRTGVLAAAGIRRMVGRRQSGFRIGGTRLRAAFRLLLPARRQRLLRALGRIRAAGSALVPDRRRGTQREAERLTRAVRSMLETLRHEHAEVAGRVDALSPLAILARGYAIPLGPGGRVLRGREEFAEGRRFDLRIASGTIPCAVVPHAVAPQEEGEDG